MGKSVQVTVNCGKGSFVVNLFLCVVLDPADTCNKGVGSLAAWAENKGKSNAGLCCLTRAGLQSSSCCRRTARRESHDSIELGLEDRRCTVSLPARNEVGEIKLGHCACILALRSAGNAGRDVLSKLAVCSMRRKNGFAVPPSMGLGIMAGNKKKHTKTMRP